MVRQAVYLAALVLTCFAVNVQALGNQLSLNWTSGEVHTPMGKTIRAHQSVCTKNYYLFHTNNWGMGSDLHTWTQAVCNSMQLGATLLEVSTNWIWNDHAFCRSGPHVAKKTQPLGCYFNMEKHCPGSTAFPVRMSYNHSYDRCPKYIQDDRTRQIFRASAIEYLFSNLSSRLVADAENEIPSVFGDYGIPENMITVHLRWGDKAREMKLVSQAEYVDAIDKIARTNNITNPKVYITTESKEALDQIELYVKKNKPTWTLYNYQPSVFDGKAPKARHSIRGMHGGLEPSPMKMAERTGGVQGKASMIALLYAMESKYYVLTSGSNWSRLIDELRRTKLDHKCGNCTQMIDLREAFLEHNWRRLEEEMDF